VAWLSLWTQVLSAAFMVAGGWLSDRLGRRRTLAVYLLLMSPPVLWLAWVLWQHGWIQSVPAAERAGRVVPAVLVTALWVATLLYAVAQGLMYGTRSAIFMDVTNPKVAATQFTAYMAMMNLAIAYSATWQGIAVEALGYPVTLAIDAVFGLACLLFLPFIRPSQHPEGDGGAPTRARWVAAILALGCLAWVPYRLGLWPAGAAAPILETLYTLVFVASAVFLAAGGATLGTRLGRAGLWLAPLLLAMHARHAFPDAGMAYVAVPVLAACLLAWQARLDWQALRPRSPAPGPAPLSP
jgi:PAT family beta-lactamase induction signal transducer AmpG